VFLIYDDKHVDCQHADKIAAEVADSVRSTIVEQVANGVTTRMAVLYLLLGGTEFPATGEA